MKINAKDLCSIKDIQELKSVDSINNILKVINSEITPMSVTAQTYEELFSVIAVLKKQWNNFNSDVYFKNENVKMIYSLLYARPEVRNINIGYSEELLEDAEKAKKWYINLVKKIHPDANKACPEEAQKAMTELEIIYERIQKCFANEEEELMESKNKKEELEIRKASSYDINFPDNKYLENSDKQRIQKAVTDGGISIGNKTFISEKELNKLLVTDRKGVTNAMMSTPPGDLKKVGDVEYMSTPHLQKEISQKRQQPRSITEQEKLGYAQDCVNAFSNNEELSRQRAIEADLITKQRAQLGKKVIKERKSKVSELSGKPLDGMAEVHHKDRVADKPERAFDPTNLAVIRKDEHSEYHNSDYPQNEKGYEQFEKKYKK